MTHETQESHHNSKLNEQNSHQSNTQLESIAMQESKLESRNNYEEILKTAPVIAPSLANFDKLIDSVKVAKLKKKDAKRKLCWRDGYVHEHKREKKRRKRQIEYSRLRSENGLYVE